MAWLAMTAIVAAAAPAASPQSLAALQLQADRWMQRGWDEPDPVLVEISAALAQPELDGVSRRTLQRTRAIVAARGGRAAAAATALDALDALGQAGDALARPDAALARALREEQRGRSAQALVLAREATEGYAALCQAPPVPRHDCDPRAQWLAAQTLLQRERRDADPGSALARAEEALVLARRAGDPALEAWTLAIQASIVATQGDVAGSRERIARAMSLLHGLHRPDIEYRVWMEQFRIATLAGDAERADQSLAAGFAAARHARSPRLAASAQVNESDLLVRRGRPAQALAAVEAGLPVARRLGDLQLERLLMHNGALAYIGLGRVREAKAQADHLLEMWASNGTPGEQSIVLREIADALAAAGDVRAALDLYHREREVTDRLIASQRDKAEQTLRARYGRDSDQRQIQLRARDNAIQAAELGNRVLTERLWELATAAVLLGALLVGLLLRRVRAAQAALQRSQARLKVESERDALTGAANRRHGQARLQAESDAATGAWRGAMLLVDVDHFKRVNDENGHGAGDEVLVEVARRLQSALRGNDIVLRWGGEEFLVLASNQPAAALEKLAARLMHAVSATPVALPDGRALTVTVSIGYAAFPLPPRGQAVGWERALNLVDMALYTAKNQGRHRAVGVTRLADDDSALDEAERDFERACHEGRVQLAVEAGA